MRFLYLIVIFFLISCNTLKKEYVCGDRPCVDKKEFNKYFSETLTIEIKNLSKKTNQSIDLTELNNDPSNTVKKDAKKHKNLKKLQKKIEKEKLIAERKKILEERKIKKAEDKISKKKLKKVVKLSESKNFIKKNKKLINKKKIKHEPVVTINTKSVCDEIINCDIDKIAEVLKKRGKDKPFPDITTN